MALALASGLAASAASPGPRVVEVPSRPAFVRPPARAEMPARPGLPLVVDTFLRTRKPGRMQVQLADGRSFRLGGDAVLRLGARGLDLKRGQIIAWVIPGRQGGAPLTIRTRVATASIVGTTVFIEATAEEVKFFSWEGRVRVTTPSGQRYDLSSGQQLAFAQGSWLPPRRLSVQEAASRRRNSLLLNGFAAPMETLPLIERELGLSAGGAGPAAAPPAAPQAPPFR